MAWTNAMTTLMGHFNSLREKPKFVASSIIIIILLSLNIFTSFSSIPSIQGTQTYEFEYVFTRTHDQVQFNTTGHVVLETRDTNESLDTLDHHVRPLINRFLLGPYKPIRQPQHTMDAVVMATAPDATVTISVHNLYHLLGFRRFIFFVNNESDCAQFFDLLPQHFERKPHRCFSHSVFYTQEQKQHLSDPSYYPKIHRGGPGKNKRGNVKVHVPRMGWYLQQFSKLLVQQVVPDLSDQYLAIDGDIIFTRPYNFTQEDGKIGLPQTSKAPRQWTYFVDLILKNDKTWQNQTAETSGNHVIGWMVLDRTIAMDLVKLINETIPSSSDNPFGFPFNILDVAEQVIDNRTYFSEFFTYSHFALRHPKNPYTIIALPETSRNVGGFDRTCILSKTTYKNVQSLKNSAPYMIWEEHKQHSFNACPNGEEERDKSLKRIGIFHDFHPPPWGGGNQFLLALRRGLENDQHVTVVAKNDEDGPALFENSTQVLLANSITFAGNTDVLDVKKKMSDLALVHRVDGPYYVARYSRPLNVTNPKVPDEDRQTKNINGKYACATVFQSKWSMEANIQIGLVLRNPVVVGNTVDPTIFFPPVEEKETLEGRKIKIVATSFSDNARKGFDTMLWMDQHLDFTKFEFFYKGRIPKVGFEPENIQIHRRGGSEDVADFLRNGDIYFAPSRDEPASNAVLEALACGLPVLFQEGSGHGELVGTNGLGFTSTDTVLEQLSKLVSEYSTFVQNIDVPRMEHISRKYLSLMRWCFYMKHVML